MAFWTRKPKIDWKAKFIVANVQLEATQKYVAQCERRIAELQELLSQSIAATAHIKVVEKDARAGGMAAFQAALESSREDSTDEDPEENPHAGWPPGLKSRFDEIHGDGFVPPPLRKDN